MELQQQKIINAVLHDIGLQDNVGEMIVASGIAKKKLNDLTHIEVNLLIKHLKDIQVDTMVKKDLNNK
jgi:hypothetical protein